MIPRGYRYGDDLRRVHWRSTARYGELMVRREEQPQRARCTVLLDTRRPRLPGRGPGLGLRVGRVGRRLRRWCTCWNGASRVRLLTDTGSSVPGEGADGFAGASQESADAAGLMMDTLAVIDHSDGAGLSRAYDVLRGGNEGLLVAFLGDLDEEQAAVAARMRQRSGGAVAFVLDSDALGAGTDRGARPVGPERGAAADAARGGLDGAERAARRLAGRAVAAGRPGAHGRRSRRRRAGARGSA